MKIRKSNIPFYKYLLFFNFTDVLPTKNWIFCKFLVLMYLLIQFTSFVYRPYDNLLIYENWKFIRVIWRWWLNIILFMVYFLFFVLHRSKQLLSRIIFFYRLFYQDKCRGKNWKLKMKNLTSIWIQRAKICLPSLASDLWMNLFWIRFIFTPSSNVFNWFSIFFTNFKENFFPQFARLFSCYSLVPGW